ncbi:hypothetical protein GOBAR_DD24125 [Gossypium barbadense]|nr:hypothetical protein GOBAR_DD24125 [Gossypium barbadense]
MAISMQPHGIQSMLKEGHKHLSGLDEAVLKNIDACKQLSTITRTSLGPDGMNKMVINHLDKLFVTNDAATIVNELEVQHPAAKLLVLAGKAQQEEIGDGANLKISFAGELLQNAEELVRTGLHPSEIISGYTKAITKTLEILEELVEKGSETMDVRNKEQVVSRMKAAVASKQYGLEDILSSHIADACIQVCPKNPVNFDVDNVRVSKLVGGVLHNCTVIRGMVLKGDAVGSIKRVEKAKVAVFATGVDSSATETKGTVLIHSAEQLENYAKTEEAKVEELIKAVADSGAKVIVSGGAVGEMALHFCDLLYCSVVSSSSGVTVRGGRDTDFWHHKSSSYVLNSKRGPSHAWLVTPCAWEPSSGTKELLWRSQEERFGAKDIRRRRPLDADRDVFSRPKTPTSSRQVPRTLAENAGLNPMDIISKLYEKHASGNAKVGIDLRGDDPEDGVCKDVSTVNVWDLYVTKFLALKYAADAACTVLRVDQIIMAKPAGGPVRRDQLAGMDED